MELINFIKSLEITYQGGFVFLDLAAWITTISYFCNEIFYKFRKG